MGEIKLVAAICPRCGANLNIPEDLSKAHCMYCGTQILVHGMGDSRRVECRVCDGFGRVDICKACNGTGRCTWTSRHPGVLVNGIPVTTYKSHCEDGRCSACEGSGKRFLAPCPACDGSGRCPSCLGTGNCSACRGFGAIPSPRGDTKCQACEGTGMVDVDSKKRSWQPLVVKCPECGEEMGEEDSVCPNCGYIGRKCPQCDTPWVHKATYCSKCGFGKADGD